MQKSRAACGLFRVLLLVFLQTRTEISAPETSHSKTKSRNSLDLFWFGPIKTIEEMDKGSEATEQLLHPS